MSTRTRQVRSFVVLTLRLLRLAVVIFAVLLTTVIGVGAVLWRYQSDFLARYVSRTVTREVLREGYRLDLGGIDGSPFDTIALRDVVVRAAGGDRVLAVEEIRFRYPPLWGFRGELSLETLTIEGADVLLEESPDGGLVLPWRQATRPSRLEPRPAHRVDELNIADIDVRLVTADGDTVAIVESYYLDGKLVVHGDEARLSAVGTAGRVPVALIDVDWLTFDATLGRGEVRFENVVVDVGESHATGRGSVAIEGPIDYVFEVDSAHVATADAWKSIDLADVLGHGALDGRFRIEKAPIGVHLDWYASGVLNGDRIDRFEGRVQITEETIDITDLLLVAGEAEIRGDVSLEVEPPRRYEAELEARGLDLSDVPIHGELVPLHPHRLNGRVTLSGRDYELDYPDMSVIARAGASSYLGVPIDTLVAELELVPGDSVLIQEVIGRLGGGVVRAAGHIAVDRTCDVTVHGIDVPLGRFEALHDVEHLSASSSFAGRVFGDVEHPEFRGTATIDRLVLPGVEIQRGEISSAEGVLVPFRADVTARGHDVRVAGRLADSVHVAGSVGDVIVIDSLRAVRADSTLVLSGVVGLEDGVMRSEIGALALDLPLGRATLLAPSSVTRSIDGRVRVDPSRFAFGGGEVTLALETAANGRRARTTLHTVGVPLLDLVDPYVADVELAGAAGTIDLVYEDDPLFPKLEGRAAFDGARVGAIAFQRAAFTFGGRGDSLGISDIDVALDAGRISGRMALAGTSSPVLDLFEPDPLRALSRGPRRVMADLSARGLDVALAGHIADIVDPSPPDTSRALRLLYTRDREAVEDLWHSIHGRADVALRASGTLEAPRLRLRATSDSLIVRDQPLESVVISAVYDDSLLTISQGEVVAGGHTTQITGFVPVVVNLASREAALVQKEMLVSMDMPETPLRLLTVIFPELVVIQGHFTGTGTLQGTPAAPKLDGRFKLENGEMRLAGRTEWLWAAKANVVLTNDAIVVNDFFAREGSKGRVRARGNWSRLDEYRFQIELENFTFSEAGMIGLVDGTINMSPDVVTAGRLLPRFDGVVKLKYAEIYRWPDEGPEQTSGAIDAIYDISADVVRINVNTNELQTTTNAVIGDGELTVRNYPETLRLGGTLSVLEGGGTVYGNHFRVRRGELRFLEVDGVNPQLDIASETRIRGAYARQRGYAGTSPKILATVTGTLKEPVIQLTTEPSDLGLSETEIFEYLTIGRFTSDGAAAGGLEPTAEILLGLIAQDIARALPYVDHVEVTTSEESASISFVKSLSDEWTIGYTTGVSSSPDQEISVEARLSRILVVKGGVIREELGTSGETGGRYNLDLRLHFEY